MFKTHSAPNMIFVILLFSGLSMLSLVLARPHGPHGGTLKKADNYFIEMKNTENTLSAYFLNKKLKAIPTEDITGEVKFFFPDRTDLTVPLKLTKENSFTCATPQGFFECMITFNYLGKLVSAKFSNPVQLVSKNRPLRYSN